MMEYIVDYTKAKSLEKVDFDAIAKMQLTDNNGKVSQYKTIARLARNDRGIFFSFECEDDKVNATMTGYNEPIYDEETVEFFFSSGGEISKYLELEWNAIGGVFCANVTNDMQGHTRLDFVKDNIITSEIIRSGENFTIRGFIPRELFDGDMSGEWRFNAYRIKRREDNSMYLMAYSPTYVENFHKPLSFAKLIFSKEDK